MKTCKTYRLSPRTIEAIKKLKEMYPTWTETEIVEAALQNEVERRKESQKTMNIYPYKNPVTHTYVTNSWGRDDIDFDAAVNLMDDDIREELHRELAPCSEQEFFEAYCKRHMEEFGEEFFLDCQNPQY